MKRLKIKLVGVFLMISTFALGQYPQKHVWYMKNCQIDFSGVTPVVTSGSVYGAGPDNSTGNGIHDAIGNKIFTTNGGEMISPYGQIDILENWENFNAEPSHIIPKPGGSSCEYYVVYNFFNPNMDGSTPGLYCSTGGFYNVFYAEINMAPNGGAGQVISNGNELTGCEYFNESCAIAISTSIVDGNRYLYLFGANKDYSGEGEILKFEVTSAGINLVNTLYTGSYLDDFRTMELELSHDRSKLALADFTGNKVLVFHLNPLNGNIVPGSGLNGDGTSEFNISASTSNKLTGLEFSENGEMLYVGSRDDGIFSIDLNLGVVSSAALMNSEDFGNSELELAYDPAGDHKIYAVSEGGSILGCVVDPNSASPTFDNSAIIDIEVYSDMWSANENYGVKVLPSQIDGEDYVERFDGVTGECCATLSGYDEITYTASTSETWEPGVGLNPFNGQTEVHIYEELRIPAGINLHIKDMLFRFYEGAKVVIEPSARLVLTNTTLTSMDCEGLMWQGVELQGNHLASQIPFSNQGYLLMQSNSEISNALNGISVHGITSSGATDWSKTGGIVKASNSTFRNNMRDVVFMSYFYKNHSSFNNCTFITDDELNNGLLPDAHAIMYHVENIGFYGNDFLNTTSGLYPDNNRGYGIYSIEADYKVSYQCDILIPYGTVCPDANKDGNTFENLYYGIHATSANSMYTVDIRYNDFINNTRATYLGGIDYAIFVENDIEVGAPLSYSYGLYLENCTGYKVENNDFSTSHSTWTYGALIANSNDGGTSPDQNEIYRNNFDNLNYGIIGVASNVQMFGGNPVVNTGLTFKCNNFTNSSHYDILTLFGGVSPFQGACTTSSPGQPHSQANNVFSPSPSLYGDYWNANSSLFQTDYRYADGMPTYQTEPGPGLYNSDNTTISMCGIYEPSESCPENKWDKSKGTLFADILMHKTQAEEDESLIDGGNTADLLTIVSEGSDVEVGSALLDASPYLSDEVLITYLNGRSARSYMTEILIANSPLSTPVFDVFSSMELPRGVFEEVNEHQTGVSAKSELDAKISYNYSESALNRNELIRRYLHDTLVDDGEDSVKLLLLESDNPKDYLNRLASLHLKLGENEDAGILIDEIRSIAGAEGSDFADYLDLTLTLASTDANAYTLLVDGELRSEMEYFATKADGSKECLQAAQLLRNIVGVEYEELVPTYTPGRIGVTEEIEELKSIELSVFPNPANDEFSINLTIDEDATAELQMFDLTGKLVLTSQLVNGQNTLSAANLDNGTYLLKIQTSTNKLLTNKIVVNH